MSYVQHIQILLKGGYKEIKSAHNGKAETVPFVSMDPHYKFLDASQILLYIAIEAVNEQTQFCNLGTSLYTDD